MGTMRRLVRPGPGTEGANARSAETLRIVLSAVALPVCALAAVWAFAQADVEGPARSGFLAVGVLLAVVAVAAAIDLVVLLRRRGRRRE